MMRGRQVTCVSTLFLAAERRRLTSVCVFSLVSRLQSDTLIVQNGITTNVSMFLRCGFNILGIFLILFLISWRNALATILMMLPISVVMPVYNRLIRFTMNRYQKTKADASAVANENFSNIKTIKAFANEDFTKKMYGGLIDESYMIGKA